MLFTDNTPISIFSSNNKNVVIVKGFGKICITHTQEEKVQATNKNLLQSRQNKNAKLQTRFYVEKLFEVLFFHSFK